MRPRQQDGMRGAGRYGLSPWIQPHSGDPTTFLLFKFKVVWVRFLKLITKIPNQCWDDFWSQSHRV